MKRVIKLSGLFIIVAISVAACGENPQVKDEIQYEIEGDTSESADEQDDIGSDDFIDFESLGVSEYQYLEEFVLEDDLKSAITTLALSYAEFDNSTISDDSENWMNYFISHYIQNSYLTFEDLTQESAASSEMTTKQLNYMQYSLTGVEIDFAEGGYTTVDASQTASFNNYGSITDYTFEYDGDNVIVTATMEIGYGTFVEEGLEVSEVTVYLAKNPYSCFNGYSIVSMSKEVITPFEQPEDLSQSEKTPTSLSGEY